MKREMLPLPCAVCGNPEVQGHHTDYNEPLDVMWLCRKHHRLVHFHSVKVVMDNVDYASGKTLSVIRQERVKLKHNVVAD